MQEKLQTKRLVLRKLEKNDLEYLNSLIRDPETTRFMIKPDLHSIQEVQAYLDESINEWESKEPKSYGYLVIEKDPVGFVRLEMTDPSTGVLLWIIQKTKRNKGFATEAAQKLIEEAKNSLDPIHLRTYCDTRNLASKKVIEKLGFKLVGIGDRSYPNRNEKAREFIFDYPT